MAKDACLTASCAWYGHRQCKLPPLSDPLVVIDWGTAHLLGPLGEETGSSEALLSSLLWHPASSQHRSAKAFLSSRK